MARTILTADATYYVNAVAGSDSNDGLSSATAFSSITRFLDLVSGKLDLATFYRVTCLVAPGTYVENLMTPNNLTGFSSRFGYSQVTIKASDPIPSNTKIDASGGFAIFSQNTITPVTFAGFQLINSQICAYGDSYGLIVLDGCDFAEATGGHAFSIYHSRIVYINRDYSISGPAPIHWSADDQSLIFIQPGHAITIANNTQIVNFVEAYRGGEIRAAQTTYIGAARGRKFKATEFGIISTGTGDPNYFPGDQPGTTAGLGLQAPGSYF